jgi:rfaE bifunctional protein kinase chain/domain
VSIAFTLDKFKGKKILVAGDVMLDAYLWGSVDRISPEAPVPVVAVEKREERLGGAANVALNLKELGAVPLLCSVIGTDDSSKLFFTALKRSQISGAGIISSPKRITTVKTRVLSKSHQLIRYDTETTVELAADEEKKLLTVIARLIEKEKPAAIIFEDYNKGVLTERVIKEVIERAVAGNIFTAVDPKKKNFLTYKNVSLFKPNLREIREALHHDTLSITLPSLKEIHHELHRRLNNHITLITLSEHGVYYSDGKNSGIIAAHKRDIADVSGAGDTVIAVATLALVSGLSLKAAAETANLAGGLVCEHAGVVPVTREMLIESK